MLEYLAAFCRDLLGDAAFKGLAALTGGFFLGLFDWGGGAIKAVFVLMCLDFGLGLLRAWMGNRLSGGKLRYGFGKFLLYFLAILAAHHVDQAAAPVVHVDFRAYVIVYLAVCEVLSIFKHLNCLGLPFPKHIIKRLETLRDCELPPRKEPK